MSQANSNSYPIRSRRAVLAGIAAAGTVAATIPTATLTAAPAFDPVFDLIDAHRQACLDHAAALDEQERLELIGDKEAADLAGEGPCHAEFNALDVLISAAATTLPGIVAKLAYLEEIAKRDAWMFDDREGTAIALIESFAASLKNIGVQS
jgi:hypothetical protein